MSVEQAVIEKLRALPAGKQEEVLRFVSSLADEPRKPFRSPEGILADIDFDFSEKMLAEERREMWANFPREDIA